MGKDLAHPGVLPGFQVKKFNAMVAEEEAEVARQHTKQPLRVLPGYPRLHGVE